MDNENIAKLKRDIIAIGRLMWEKNLATALNGNLSVRVDDKVILITATQTCLGLLQETDIVQIDYDGNVIGEGQASSERVLHTAIYKNFPDIEAVVHTHTTYTSGYFLENDTLTPRIFESKFYLGEVKAVPQFTPAVSDVGPVIEAFKANNIVVLKNHGVVAMGKDLFDGFLLVQCLEDAALMDAVSRLYKKPEVIDQKPEAKEPKAKSENWKPEPRVKKARTAATDKTKKLEYKKQETKPTGRKFKLFSAEQINEIVRLVNTDVQMQELGKKTQMNMDLAVKLNETGEVYSFHFENGQITDVDKDENAEFLISAPENIWRAVFKREIDPFVATTQKKMSLRGDFARISKWYAPCSRIFEVWANVPIE